MLIQQRHLQAAENVRTVRDIHRWLSQVAGDDAITVEVRDICKDFAMGLEPALGAAIMNADISQRIWNVFQLLTLANSSKAAAMRAPSEGTTWPR